MGLHCRAFGLLPVATLPRCFWCPVKYPFFSCVVGVVPFVYYGVDIAGHPIGILAARRARVCHNGCAPHLGQDTV